MTRTRALLATALLPALALAQAEPSAPPPPQAAWILVAKNSTGDAHFVTPYQIRQIAADRFVVWVKKVQGRPPQATGGQQQAEAPSYSLSQYEFDCAAGSSALLQEFRYRGDGEKAVREAGDAAHRPPRADSLGDASLKAVCQAATVVTAQ